MTIRSHHLIGVTVLLVAGLLLLFIGNVVWNGLGLKYSFVAEGNLRSAATKLDLSPEFKLLGSTYYPGSCLDNCPKLTSVYTVHDAAVDFDTYHHIVEKKLATQGYENISKDVAYPSYVKPSQASYISDVYLTDSCLADDYIESFKDKLPSLDCTRRETHQSQVSGLLVVDFTYN